MDESGANVEVDGGAERVTGRVAVNRVDAAFFDLFGARVRMGRTFDATDFGPGPSQTIVVTRTFATEIAGTENVLGRRVRYVTGQDADVSPEPERWFEIVGVVEDFPADYDQATVYHPLLPVTGRQVTVTLRAGPDAALAATRLREITTAIDPGLRIERLQSLGEIYRQRGSVGSTLGVIVGSVMLIVVCFAIAGMYTLMAFIVAQRWREVGVRCALGASPAPFGGGDLWTFVGAARDRCDRRMADGIPDRLLGSGGGYRRPEHPRRCSGYCHVMILVGVLALAGPARRAIRINPVDALRAN